MKIVGCDLHTCYQQVAMLDQATGELVERRLEHESGQLFRADSARALFGTTTAAGLDLPARQPHAAHVAGGSGAEAVRHNPDFRRGYQHRCHSKPKAVAKVAAATDPPKRSLGAASSRVETRRWAGP